MSRKVVKMVEAQRSAITTASTVGPRSCIASVSELAMFAIMYPLQQYYFLSRVFRYSIVLDIHIPLSCLYGPSHHRPNAVNPGSGWVRGGSCDFGVRLGVCGVN